MGYSWTDFKNDVKDELSNAGEWVGEALEDTKDFFGHDIGDFVKDGGMREFIMDSGDWLMEEGGAVAVLNAGLALSGLGLLIPVVNAGVVLEQGGSERDALKVAATSYVAQTVGAEIGEFAGAKVGAMTGSQLASEVAAGIANNTSQALLLDEDPKTAALIGGITPVISAALGKIAEKVGYEVTVEDPKTGEKTTKMLPNIVQNVIGAAVATTLSGQDITPEIISVAVAKGAITADMVKKVAEYGGVSLDDPNALAFTTIAVQRTVGLLAGTGNSDQIFAALNSTLNAYGGKELADAIQRTDFGAKLGDYMDKLSGDYQKVEQAVMAVDTNRAAATGKVDRYNAMRNELVGLQENVQTGAEWLDSVAQQYFQKPWETLTAQERAAFGWKPEVKAAVDFTVSNVNNAIETFQTKYAEYKPVMDDLTAQIQLHNIYDTNLGKQLEDLQGNLQRGADQLTENLKPVYDTVNNFVAKTLDPNFNVEDYKKINALPEGIDPVEHYITTGQAEGAYTNEKVYEEDKRQYASFLVDAGLKSAGVDPSSVSKEVLSEYVNGLAALEPDTLRKAFADEVGIQRIGTLMLGDIGQSGSNPYKDSTLNIALKTQLAQLGVDTAGRELGTPLTAEEKAWLWTAQNTGKNAVKISPNVDPAALAEKNLLTYINQDGTRELRAAEAVVKWDPFEGRTSEIAYYDGNDNVLRLEKYDTFGNQIDTMGTVKITEPDFMVITAQALDKYGAQGAQDILNKMGVSDVVLGMTESLLIRAEETGSTEWQNTVANAVRATGGILQSFSGLAALVGIAPSDTELGQFAANLAKLGGDYNTAEYKAGVKALNDAMNAESKLEEDASWRARSWEQFENIAGAIKDHPMAFLTEYIGVEGMQEVVPLLIGGVGASLAKNVGRAAGASEAMAAYLAKKGGLSAAAATDLAESFGGAAEEAYDRAYQIALKSDMYEPQAREYAAQVATQAGLVGATITGLSMGLGGNALENVILGGNSGGKLAGVIESIGDRAQSLTSVPLKEGGWEAIEEGLVANYTAGQLHKLDPTIDVAAETAAASTMGLVIGGTVAGGVNTVAQTGNLVVDAVNNFNPTVRAAIEAAQEAKKVGGAVYETAMTNLKNVTRAAVLSTGIAFTPQLETNFLSTVAPETYVSDAAVARSISATGNVPTWGMVTDYTNSGMSAQAIVDQINTDYRNMLPPTQPAAPTAPPVQPAPEPPAQPEPGADTTFVTPENVRAVFDHLGYTATDEEIQRFVGEANLSTNALAEGAYPWGRIVEIGQYVEQQQAQQAPPVQPEPPTPAPEPEPLPDFVQELAGVEQNLLDAVREQEAAGADRDAAIEASVQALASELGLTADQLLAQLGTTEANLGERIAQTETQLQDVEAGLLDAIRQQEAAGADRDAAIESSVQALAGELGLTADQLLAQIGTTEAALGERIAQTETQFGEQLTGLERSLLDAVREQEVAGADRDAAIESSVDQLAGELGLTRDQLLSQLGTTEAALGERIAQTEAQFEQGLAGVEQNLLTTIREQEAAGADRDAAIEASVDQLAGELGLTRDDLLAQLGTTEAALGERITQTEAQFEQGLADVEQSLLNAVRQQEAAGADRDAAIESSVQALAGELGLTAEQLLAQLGTTEAALGERITQTEAQFEQGLADVGSQIDAVEAALGRQLSDTEQNLIRQIGQTESQLGTQLLELGGDLGQQIADVESAFGRQLSDTEQSFLEQLTAAESGLGERLVGVETALSTQMQAVQDDLTARIGEFEAAGQERDAAIQSAITSLAGDLGATEQQLLDALGVTKTELSGQLGALETQLGAVGGDVQNIANIIGKPAQAVTQVDVDFIADVIAQNTVLNEQQLAKYDINGDGVIDALDQMSLQDIMLGKPVMVAPTSTFAPTGIFQTQQQTQQQIQQAQEQTQQQLQQQQDVVLDQLTAINTQIQAQQAADEAQRFFQLAAMSPDAGGQQVQVKTPDPLQLRYIYDWSSIFANPQQQGMFVSPYAEGGMVDEDEFLRLIGGG